MLWNQIHKVITNSPTPHPLSLPVGFYMSFMYVVSLSKLNGFLVY